jgi:hypothetical protein
MHTQCIHNAYTMHTQCIHNAYIPPEGFEGDALILDKSHLRASALERSSRSPVSAIGLWGLGVINFERAEICTTPLQISVKSSNH